MTKFETIGRQTKKFCLLFHRNEDEGGQLYKFWTYDTSPHQQYRSCVTMMMMTGGMAWRSNPASYLQAYDYNRRWWHKGTITPFDRKGSWK